MTEYVITNKNNVLYGPKFTVKTPAGGLGWYINEQCTKYAKKIMQSCPYDNTTLTFGDYKTQTLTFAANLRSTYNIGKGDIVLSCMRNSLRNTLPVVAAFHLGAITSSVDPTQSVRDCEHLIALIRPKVAVVDEESLELIETTLANINHSIPIIVNSATNQPSKGGKHPQLAELIEEDKAKKHHFKPIYIDDENVACAILFSSGTTGLPKGIILSHRAMFVSADYYRETLGNPLCVMNLPTLYWVSGINVFVSQFILGSQRVAMRHFDSLFNTQVIAKYKVEAFLTSTTNAYNLFEMKALSQQYDLSTLKAIFIGGTPIIKELSERLHAAFPRVAFITGYGMTEVGFISSYFAEFRRDFVRNPAASGKLSRGTALKVVDPESGAILGANEKGEFYVKTPQMMNGYYNNSVEQPLDAEGFLKTGDIGHYDEEYFVFVYDRLKDMFKYQSWHIVPTSIETIIQEHPQVVEAVVFGIPHEIDGFIPSAAVVLKDGNFNASNITNDIAEFVAQRVADRQRLRGGVHIVQTIAKTPSGKIQRRKVQDAILTKLNHTQIQTV